MAKSITKYSIFLASPSDLEFERNEIKTFIDELNLSFGNSNNIHLDLLKWETHSAPAITNSYTQDIINNDIGNEYDLFVGILWKKFGTPTEVANSGTEEEFLRAVNRFKSGENIQIMIYFKTEMVNLDDIDPLQLSKINEFKNSLTDKGVYYSTFSSVEELGNQLRIHIPKRISELKNNSETQSLAVIIPSNDENKSAVPSEEDYGFFDYMIEFETLLWSSTNALNSINTATNEVATLIESKSNELNLLNKVGTKPIQYVQHFKMTSKVMLEYAENLKIETPNFYDNFESSIKIGLKFINTFSIFDGAEYEKNLNHLYESSLVLKGNMPKAIDGMTSFYKIIKRLPKIQSNINFASRTLERRLSDLINKLNNSYKLISEFVSEIELKLNNIDSGTKDDSLLV
jgi:hypothetical protein